MYDTGNAYVVKSAARCQGILSAGECLFCNIVIIIIINILANLQSPLVESILFLLCLLMPVYSTLLI